MALWYCYPDPDVIDTPPERIWLREIYTDNSMPQTHTHNIVLQSTMVELVKQIRKMLDILYYVPNQQFHWCGCCWVTEKSHNSWRLPNKTNTYMIIYCHSYCTIQHCSLCSRGLVKTHQELLCCHSDLYSDWLKGVVGRVFTCKLSKTLWLWTELVAFISCSGAIHPWGKHYNCKSLCC